MKQPEPERDALRALVDLLRAPPTGHGDPIWDTDRVEDLWLHLNRVDDAWQRRSEVLTSLLFAQPACEVPGEGVYVLLEAGAVVYVGRSKNVSTRVDRHKAVGRKFDRSIAVSGPTLQGIFQSVEESEQVFIAHLRPSGNAQHSTRPLYA